jgi:hypothetical protein
LWRSLVCVRLALWDEETRRLLSFHEAQVKRDAFQPGGANSAFRPFERA